VTLDWQLLSILKAILRKLPVSLSYRKCESVVPVSIFLNMKIRKMR
jgi:hypothetical protein